MRIRSTLRFDIHFKALKSLPSTNKLNMQVFSLENCNHFYHVFFVIVPSEEREHEIYNVVCFKHCSLKETHEVE